MLRRLELNRHQQAVPGREGQRPRQPARQARRDPRRAGRERRGQVDHDEDHLRRRPPRRGRDALERPGPCRSLRRAQARALGISMVYQHFAVRHAHRGGERLAGLDKDAVARRGQRAHPSRWPGLRAGRRSRSARCTRSRSASASASRSCARCSPNPSCSSSTSRPRCSRRRRSTSCSSRCASWPPRAAPSSTSATSSTRSAALCHHCTVLRGGKVTGEVDPTPESNASLSRLMIGAEPPRRSTSRRRWARRCWRCKGLSLPQADPFGTAFRHRLRGARRRDRRHRRRLRQRPAGADGGAVGETCARRPARSLFGQDIATSPRAAPRGPALRARGAPGPRRGADARWRRTRCSRAPRHGGPAAGSAAPTTALAEELIRASTSRPAGRRGGRSLSGGNLQKFIVGREDRRGPRC